MLLCHEHIYIKLQVHLIIVMKIIIFSVTVPNIKHKQVVLNTSAIRLCTRALSTAGLGLSCRYTQINFYVSKQRVLRQIRDQH